jgi:hypothetical protein
VQSLFDNVINELGTQAGASGEQLMS